jgi:hypothetical protein
VVVENSANLGRGEFVLTACSGGNRNWLLLTSPGQVESISSMNIDAKSLNQGVVGQLTDRDGKKHRIGFYSGHQMPSINAPDYSRSFFFFVDQQVFGNTAQVPFVRLKKGILHRTLTITQANEVVVSFSYLWPFFREHFIADDFDYTSKDIVYLLVSALKYAHPKWLAR